jgi:hypothetical protein
MASIFDYLKSVTQNKKDLSEEPDFDKDYSVFMINRFLSMNKKTVVLSFMLDSWNIKDNRIHYHLLMDLLPKEKIFFKYYKKGEKEISKQSLNIIKKYFIVNEQKAIEIYDLLSDEQFEKIKNSFGGKQ